MVVERIRAYISAVKVAPTKILFYRDGVSTGQFEQVRDYELPQVKEAWREACPGMPIPKITLVVAVKRHHTRFYPISQAHKNGNCAPGTLVDSAVVSPHYSDFYLQSHHGLKGTAIPTHYVVVTNEIGLKEKELQELTWKMCYTYVRATVGVSYAPPAYYADRLCERGRAYLRDWFSPEKGSDHYQEYESKRAIAENTLKPATQAAIALLPTVTILPGRNAARKSAAQKDLERAFGRNVDLTVEDEVLKWAREEFETRRNGGVGPWARTLDGTMFWM
jgi:eukaryotic translation initiation factor 2C